MSRATEGLVVLCAFAAAASVFANVIIRRWWIASPVAAGLTGCAFVIYAVAQAGWRARPSDVAFWLPMMGMQAAILA